jgi:hypothetical protein
MPEDKRFEKNKEKEKGEFSKKSMDWDWDNIEAAIDPKSKKEEKQKN